MIMYFLYLFIIIIEYLIFVKYKIFKIKNRKFFFVTIAFLEIVLLAGFRQVTIGADTQSYLNGLHYYKNIPKGEVLFSELVYPFKYEIGYFSLVKICAFLSMSDTIFLFLIAILIYLPIFMFIYKYSSNVIISILVYFAFGYFSYSLGIFRQMIAGSIILCSLTFIFERKIIKFLLMVLLASLFHSTALIVIPLYFIYKINYKAIYFISILSQIFMYFFGRQIILFVFLHISNFSGYVDSVYDSSEGLGLNIILFNVIMLLFLIIEYSKDKKNTVFDYNNNQSKFIFFGKAICIAGVLQILGYKFGIFGRIVCYYSIFLIPAIPLLIQHYAKTKNDRFIISFVSAVILLILIFFEFSGNIYVTPYDSIFQLEMIKCSIKYC